MKNLLKIVLLVVILGLAYWVYIIPVAKLEFDQELENRQVEVVQKLKDIREAQRAYKRNHDKYTGSFDTLINFIKTDSMDYERSMGSMDDSVAVARGLVKTVKMTIAMKDTLFSGREVNFDDLKFIPFTDGRVFEMGAREILTESEVIVPVFEAKVPYVLFLKDLNEDQEIINLVDKFLSMDRYPGLKVGSLIQPNNDAGNWED